MTEKARIEIVHDTDDIEVFFNNPEADTKTLIEMHSCFVKELLHMLTEAGISPEDATEIVGQSDEAAVKAFVEEILYA